MRSIVCALAGAMALIAPSAVAQDFPARPITIVNPQATGAGVDVITRLYADAATRTFGQRVVVENKTGGGGVTAAMAVKESKADGYTLFLCHVGTQSTLAAMQTLPFDPHKDFDPVTQTMSFATYLVVPAASPAKSAADIVALAKSKGGLRLASQGVGSGTHILAEIWKSQTNAPFEHIPYRGSGQFIPDLIAGRVDFTFISYLTIRELVKDGKLRILAAASTKRWEGLPDVPTMAEVGYPGVDQDTWFGLAAPAGTPKPVIEKLHAGFVQSSSDAPLRKRAADDGMNIVVSQTPQAFGELWVTEEKRWGKIVRDLGIKAE